jgi:hypothetical protein
MHEPVQQSFPVVYSLDAHPSDDGATLTVEATCFDKTVVRFAAITPFPRGGKLV